eukprot:GHVL01044609.1.p2 GENE.GHVL01044609.1~~GHVL01044609.1.p2  ORF type:complete len:105 (+),score=10.88 GHVL01044609.1:58-372(+)
MCRHPHGWCSWFPRVIKEFRLKNLQEFFVSQPYKKVVFSRQKHKKTRWGNPNHDSRLLRLMPETKKVQPCDMAALHAQDVNMQLRMKRTSVPLNYLRIGKPRRV